MFSLTALRSSVKNVTRNIFLGVFLLVLGTVSTAYGIEVVGGPEFQVNTYTGDDQKNPSVAALNNGNFVVAWESDGQDDSDYGIYGQIFNEVGSKIGSEFQVNTYINNNQQYPSVAGFSNGNFVVVWHSDNQDGSSYGVYAQIFDERGTKLGNEFRANSYVTNNQSWASVSACSRGNFVIVWVSEYQDGSGRGVYGQLFNEDGVKIGSEFQVNTYTTNYQQLPFTAYLGNGNFVVAWQSESQDGSGYAVYGQLFDNMGTKIGDEFQGNTYSTRNQLINSIATLNNNFVLVWMSEGQDGNDFGIFGQLFDSFGNKIGVEFQVNAYITDAQKQPSVAGFSNGNFIVVWESEGQDGSGYTVYGQIFDGLGVKVGSEFQINTYTTNNQGEPSIATFGDVRFVVVWDSNGQDGSGEGVFGRIFSTSLCSPNEELCATGTGQTLNYIEDVPKTLQPIVIMSSIPNLNATMILSDTTAGSLNQNSNVNATSIFNPGSGRWHAWGNVNGVNTLLGSLTFTPSLHYHDDFDIDLFITNGNDTIADVISVIGIPGNPIINVNSQPLVYNCGHGAHFIDSTLNINDPNGNTLERASVKIVGDIGLGAHSLNFTNQNGIFGQYLNGKLMLTGDSKTLTDYQDAMRSITYEYTGDSDPGIPVTLSFKVNDGLYDSNDTTREIDFSNCETDTPLGWPTITGIAVGVGIVVVVATAAVCTGVIVYLMQKHNLGCYRKPIIDGDTELTDVQKLPIQSHDINKKVDALKADYVY